MLKLLSRLACKPPGSNSPPLMRCTVQESARSKAGTENSKPPSPGNAPQAFATLCGHDQKRNIRVPRTIEELGQLRLRLLLRGEAVDAHNHIPDMDLRALVRGIETFTRLDSRMVESKRGLACDSNEDEMCVCVGLCVGCVWGGGFVSVCGFVCGFVCRFVCVWVGGSCMAVIGRRKI